MTQDFRFGHQLRPSMSAVPADLVAEARAAEACGFDVVTVPDHIGTELAAPLPILAALARDTTSIRLGTFVLNGEMRNPVQLGWEAATIDLLSRGRFELGLGAGHTPQEFAATSIACRPAGVRKAALGEAVEIIRRLLDGETVTSSGRYFAVKDAAIGAPIQERLPIMVAGNGDALLTHAGRHADIVGLNGLGRTLADGHRHSVRFGPDHLSAQADRIHAAATGRDKPPELNALVQRVVITDDREAAVAAEFGQVDGLSLDDALASPYLAFGTHHEIADQFRAARGRWGLSYFVTRDIEAMAPVIELLRADASLAS